MRTAPHRAPARWKWERDILLQGASVRASRYSARNFSFILGALTALLATTAPSMTETAAANGDTRTINLFYVHTGESISATYLVNGQYNPAALQQLNWFLRDWRHNEPIEMDPRLFERGLGGLPRRWRRGPGRDRRFGLSFAPDQRHAAGALPLGRQILAAYAGQGDGHHNAGNAHVAHPRDRHADAARRSRLLPNRGDALRASRRRQCARLAAHELRSTGPAVPRRQDRASAKQWPAAGPLRGGQGGDRGAQQRRDRHGSAQVVRRVLRVSVWRRRG